MQNNFQTQVETVFKIDVTNLLSYSNSGMKKYTKQEFLELANSFTAELEVPQSKNLENNILFWILMKIL